MSHLCFDFGLECQSVVPDDPAATGNERKTFEQVFDAMQCGVSNPKKHHDGLLQRPATFALEKFTGGWLVGHFQPALIASDDIEVAVKKYHAGDLEKSHHHKQATEYTVIASGRVRMNQHEYQAGEIIRIDPGHSTDFEALEDTVTVVLKTPSVPDDKFVDVDDSRRTSDA